jgi:2-iminobutanoate/2-iminopropanoate deaminase
MADRVVMKTEEAPAPVGAYSQAVKANGMLFLAGQVAIDPATDKLIDGDAAAQTKRVLDNIEAVLRFAGLSRGHVVRCTVFIQDYADMPAINKVYGEYFNFEPPARSAVQVAALPLGAKVEIEATAILQK